ncbi:MAG: YdcH family protein [Stenotrophomonas sp.]
METIPPEQLRQRLAELQAEHRALDERIRFIPANLEDDLEAKRLKRRKLQLKDCISRLQDLLTPDEPA